LSPVDSKVSFGGGEIGRNALKLEGAIGAYGLVIRLLIREVSVIACSLDGAASSSSSFSGSCTDNVSGCAASYAAKAVKFISPLNTSRPVSRV